LTDFGFLDRRDSLINFRGPAGTFSMVPAFQVANGEVAPETFNGKVVLLGVPASSVRDRFATPFGQFAEPMAGVEILANAIDTLIAGDYIRRIGIEADWPDLSALPFLFVACLAGYLLGRSRHLLVILPALAVVVAVCVLAWGVAFFALRLQLPLAAPLIGLISGSALFALRLKQFR
jgi:CHASE2 domain-containing sensor protein